MLLAANSLGSVSCSGWSLHGLFFFSVHAQSDMYSVEAGSLLRDLFLLSPGAAITAISSVSSVILLEESSEGVVPIWEVVLALQQCLSV